MTIGSATSGGTQTIEANRGLGYTTLKTTSGDVDLTSDTATITGAAPGDTLEAAGSFNLLANGTSGAISATSLKADNGNGTAQASGAITLSSVSAPNGYLTLQAGTGDLTIGSASALTTISLTSTSADILGEASVPSASSKTLILSAGGDIGANATPFNFALGAGGTLSGSAGGSAWLTSTGAVNVTTFSATSSVSLTVGGALRIETVTTPSVVDGLISSTTGPVTLRAASVSMDVGAGVSAGESILISSAGDVTVGQVTSASPTAGGALIDIEAGAASLGASVTPGIGSILSNSKTALIEDVQAGGAATLNAGGDIGAAAAPLAFALGGTLSGSAGGSAWLTSAGAVNVTTFSAMSGISLMAGGALRIETISTPSVANGLVSSTNGPVTLTGASLSFDGGAAVEAGGAVTLVANSGDIQLGQVVSALTATTSTTAISVSASNGAIYGNGDGNTNLVAPNSHAAISLSAQNDIGAQATPITVETSLLSAVSTAGSLYLTTTTTLPAAPLLSLNPIQGLEATSPFRRRRRRRIQGAADLTLDSVKAGTASDATKGDITAQSAGSIVVGALTAYGTVTMTATGGDISGASSVVTADHGHVTGTAGGSLWLSSVSALNGAVTLQAGTGDLTIGSVSALTKISLTSTSGDILGEAAVPSASSETLLLSAGGDIGANATPFTFALGAGGTLSGSAAGSVWLTSAGAVNVTTFSATSGVSLTAGDALRIETLSTPSVVDGLVSSANGPVTLTGASLSFDGGAAVEAGGAVTLVANSGDIQLGQVVSALTATAPTTAISLSAGNGAIYGNGDGNTNLVAPNSHAAISLSAQNDIGAQATPITVETSLLSAISTTGGLYLTTTTTLPAAPLLSLNPIQGLEATSLSAVEGGVSIQGAADLTLDSVKAGTASDATKGDITAQSAGSIVVGALTAYGTVTMTATGGDISGASSVVTADHGHVTGTASGSLSLSSVSTPNGAVTLQAGTGDLTIGSVSALTKISLTSTSGDILGEAAVPSASSETLILSAGDDIGANATPFTFALGAGGTLSGSAAGSAWLTSADAVNVTTFSATSGVTLTAGDALRIETLSTPSVVDGLVSSANGPVTLRGASVGMDVGAGVSAGGLILISSAGDVTIGQVTSTSATTSIAVIDIEAGAASLGAAVTPGVGSILGNGGTALIEDTQPGVATTLNAGETIGPISIETANLSAAADKGDLSLTVVGSPLHATSLSAANGSVDIEGAPSLTLDSVTAP